MLCDWRSEMSRGKIASKKFDSPAGLVWEADYGVGQGVVDGV